MYTQDGLLHTALREPRRTQIVTEGDSFLVAFHTACEAVAFCLELQYKLLDTPWPKAVLKLPGCQPVYDADGIMVMQVGRLAGAAARAPVAHLSWHGGSG